MDNAGNESGYSNEISAVPSGFNNDSLAVVMLYDSLDGTNWTSTTNWRTTQPLSSWYGITVVNNLVTRIDLGDNKLAGQIPAAIGDLDNLNYLNFQNNQLTGILPTAIGNLVSLDTLNLYNNQIGGTIPVEIGNLAELKYLDLSASFTGSIPAEIGNLSHLEYLSILANLTGTIPTTIGNLTNLVELRLHSNQLSGTLPTEIGNLTNLKVLLLQQNLFSGSIPSTIGNLTHLTDVYLYENRLTGTIPKEIGRLTSLQLLYLWSNQLSGALPDSMVNMTNLTDLRIQDNQFTDLPDLSNLAFLSTLNVENNQFTFEDLEPYPAMTPLSTFTYSPQDSVGIAQDTSVYAGDTLTISISFGGSANQYAWQKDGSLLSGATGSSYTINKATFNDIGSYYCEVTNTTVTGLTLYTRPIHVDVTADPAAPAAPQGLTATPGSHKVTLHWKANPELDLNKYFIYRDETSPATTLIGSIVAAIPAMPDTVYTDTTVTNGLTYYYRIKAVDLAGNESDFSNEVTAIPAYGRLIVATDGSGDYGTIKAALQAATSGDTILLKQGTYSDYDDRNLNFQTGYTGAGVRDVVIRGEKGADATIVDIKNSGYFLELNSRETIASKIIGITIKNASTSAIRVKDSTQLELDHCRFIANSGDDGGAVFVFDGSTVTVKSSYFEGNTALVRGGGALFLDYANADIKNSIFYKNHGAEAGAITVLGNTSSLSLQVVHCLFLENTSEVSTGLAGAISDITSKLGQIVIYNSIFAGNKLLNPETVVDMNAARIVQHCILQPVTDLSYDVSGKGQNYSIDPRLVDPANGDFSLSDISGAIGKGMATYDDIFAKATVAVPTTDYFGNPRPQPEGTAPDIGPIESVLGMRLGRLSTVKADSSGDFPTIQAAIDGSEDGDTVLVYPGTYQENINFNGKDIVLKSVSGPDSTLIDGNQSDVVVTISSGETDQALLEGFTIQNGWAQGYRKGGGITCDGSSPRLHNLIITGNKSSDFGGGLLFQSSSAEIVNTLIYGNQADLNGGGIACFLVSNPVFINVTITDDSSGGVGGISLNSSAVTFINSIIWNNTNGNILFESSGDEDSIAVAYSNIQGGLDSIITNNHGTVNWWNGNLSTDPLFVNPEQGDFHLSVASPSIGTGADSVRLNSVWYYAPLTDLTNHSRPNPPGTLPDMGAYESPLSIPGPSTGIVFDGIVGDTIQWSRDSTQLSAFWSGFESNAGIDFFEYALGEKDSTLNGILDWTTLNANDSTITITGLALRNNHTYRFAVRAVDIYGTRSNVALSPGVTIDTEPPVIQEVDEFLAPDLNDRDWFTSNQDIVFSWIAGDNGELKYFEYSVGTSAGNADVADWTNTGLDTFVTTTGYGEGKTYFANVRAADRAGNSSLTVSSDGFQIDDTPPLPGVVFDGLGQDVDWSESLTSLGANWSGFSDQNQSGIVRYEMAIGTDSGITDILPFVDLGLDTSYKAENLSLVHGTKYFSAVRAVDLVGNVSTVAVSDGVTIDAFFGPPAVANVSPAVNTILPLKTGNQVEFQCSEPIQSYVLAVISPVMNQINYHEEKVSQDLIRITLDEYLASRDAVTIQISALQDLAGLVAGDTSFTFNTATLADFDGDGLVNASDLALFVTAWNGKDYSMELGPTLGSVPNLIPQPDNQYDLRDVMVFTRMWHWSHQNSRSIARVSGEFGPLFKPVQAGKNLVLSWPKGTVTGSVDFSYSSADLKLSEIKEIATEQQLTLFEADSLQGSASLVFTDFNCRPVPDRRFQLRFKGKQNVELRLTYALFGKDGRLLSQGTHLLDLTPVPDQFALHQNYPNPFNPVTTIHYDLPIDTQVSLVVYNLLGHKVCVLEDGLQTAGYKTVVWKGENGNGIRVAAGIYFYRLVTPQFTKVKKMVLLK